MTTWRTANNRRKRRIALAKPVFVRRNLDRWRGKDWTQISQAIQDERLGPQSPPFKPRKAPRA